MASLANLRSKVSGVVGFEYAQGQLSWSKGYIKTWKLSGSSLSLACCLTAQPINGRSSIRLYWRRHWHSLAWPKCCLNQLLCRIYLASLMYFINNYFERSFAQLHCLYVYLHGTHNDLSLYPLSSNYVGASQLHVAFSHTAIPMYLYEWRRLRSTLTIFFFIAL